MNNIEKGYLGLCYHYIRPEKEQDLFPRILGTRMEEFRKHLVMLKNEYSFISPEGALDFSYNKKFWPEDKYGLLLTFDDGLSDHYKTAKVLAENGIRAIFFIPTSILIDKLPISSAIMHYCLAKYGISGFLDLYKQALKKFNITSEEFFVSFKKGEDDPWQTISDIKVIFKYKLGAKNVRDISLYIYNNLLLRDYPNAMELLHLSEEQIKKMIKMGHSIGVHSHSHISVASSKLNNKECIREIIYPREYLEKTFDVSVNSFSYPFGQKQDCLDTKELINKTKDYELAFTVEEIINTKETSAYELGRYQPKGYETASILSKNLNKIIKNYENSSFHKQ